MPNWLEENMDRVKAARTAEARTQLENQQAAQASRLREEEARRVSQSQTEAEKRRKIALLREALSVTRAAEMLRQVQSSVWKGIGMIEETDSDSGNQVSLNLSYSFQVRVPATTQHHGGEGEFGFYQPPYTEHIPAKIATRKTYVGVDAYFSYNGDLKFELNSDLKSKLDSSVEAFGESYPSNIVERLQRFLGAESLYRIENRSLPSQIKERET